MMTTSELHTELLKRQANPASEALAELDRQVAAAIEAVKRARDRVMKLNEQRLALEARRHREALKLWIGKPVMLRYYTFAGDKRFDCRIGRLVSVGRTRAVVDYGADLGRCQMRIIDLVALEADLQAAA